MQEINVRDSKHIDVKGNLFNKKNINWNGLNDKADLYKVFNPYYDYADDGKKLEMEYNTMKSKIKNIINENELKELVTALEVKQQIKEITNKIAARWPAAAQRGENATISNIKYESNFESKIIMFCGLLNAVLCSDIYATIQNYIDEIEEIKAKCEAYERFIKYKNEEIEKRKEFEKTAEFRTQRLEVIAGIRKEIEYPE